MWATKQDRHAPTNLPSCICKWRQGPRTVWQEVRVEHTGAITRCCIVLDLAQNRVEQVQQAGSAHLHINGRCTSRHGQRDDRDLIALGLGGLDAISGAITAVCNADPGGLSWGRSC